jgi:hypothetical protein
MIYVRGCSKFIKKVSTIIFFPKITGWDVYHVFPRVISLRFLLQSIRKKEMISLSLKVWLYSVRWALRLAFVGWGFVTCPVHSALACYGESNTEWAANDLYSEKWKSQLSWRRSLMSWIRVVYLWNLGFWAWKVSISEDGVYNITCNVLVL